MRDSESGPSWSKQLGEAMPVIVASGVLVVTGTALRVWAGMDVIQTQIANIVKSDNSQDARIEQIRADQNEIKVEIGILNSVVGKKFDAKTGW